MKKEYGIYEEKATLDLVGIVRAESLEEAKEYAMRKYGKYVRVEELYDD